MNVFWRIKIRKEKEDYFHLSGLRNFFCFGSPPGNQTRGFLQTRSPEMGGNSIFKTKLFTAR